MFRPLWNHALGLLQKLTASWWRERLPAPEMFAPPLPRKLARLQRVVLTEDVCRTLFDEFNAHKQGERGDEEIGWVLMGIREENEVLVLATLPAGTARNAGVAHVRFDSDAQALASRIVRQKDKRLTIVGVVHTHPGSLRHPSGGDYHGDSLWVGHLRGGEGVFGIGTADIRPVREGNSPEPHMQVQGELCFSWYALGQEDHNYRRLPVYQVPGPDLAGPLHAVWSTVEIQARCLDRLCRQQAGANLEVVPGPALALNLKLADPGTGLRLLFTEKRVQYYLCHHGAMCAVDPEENQVERALYLILAELAGARENEAGGRPEVPDKHQHSLECR